MKGMILWQDYRSSFYWFASSCSAEDSIKNIKLCVCLFESFSLLKTVNIVKISSILHINQLYIRIHDFTNLSNMFDYITQSYACQWGVGLLDYLIFF